MEDLISSLVRGLGLGGLYALLGVSFVIIYRATGVINFATPALMILGAFFTGSFGNAIGLPFWLSVLLGMVAGCALAIGFATRGALPVTQVDGRAVGSDLAAGRPGPVWQRLHSAFQARIKHWADVPFDAPVDAPL